VPPTVWLPPSTFHVDGWRITPIWEQRDSGPVLTGVTVLADPGSGRRLDRDVWDGLPVWELVAAGPVPERLAQAADVYREADETGRPRAAAVAAALGIGEGSASNLIARARKARLLPPTRPGVSAA
jgi:hypothetical protein